MKKIIGSALLLALCFSCSQQRYAVTDIQAQRYPLIAANYSNAPEMEKVVNKYKGMLDQEMGQVIGVSTQDMTYDRPESLLTNLTSDVMEAYGEKYTNGNCDLASVNVHGHRANLGKGNITVGNMFEIYSFENTLVLIKLKGSDLTEAFESYAKIGGAGISSSARLVIKDGKLISATVKGKPVDPDKIYTIVTLDYLADGNDGMDAFKKATETIEPGITLRDAMIDYVKQQTAAGKEITSVLDGRITVEK
ncbi:5'-nucleotidase C-terminal domain-containing protein [Dysgonomonas macrotermitis]|uniref:5'-nucleotidase, C-terminal domain n=1 Tax=Dysgonomonas macrotermitis TaxID=1346286 RepID=A0A1M4W416_9BACT|nr:5'-nucleotidase C-terminal domain-containing protein [Dysgonomonas macrotermitis]SHE75692.1 5'-nucleotidase, C-terminal domain [Dysgonomonas macrotermitis]